MSQAADIWPEDISLDRASRTLTVTFEDGQGFVFPAEFLRVLSPSAEVQGHSPDERKVVPGKINVGLVGLEEVGNYAVRLIFDDHHDSGIYTWKTLYRFGQQQESLWAAYLAELEALGLSRQA